MVLLLLLLLSYTYPWCSIVDDKTAVFLLLLLLFCLLLCLRLGLCDFSIKVRVFMPHYSVSHQITALAFVYTINCKNRSERCDWFKSFRISNCGRISATGTAQLVASLKFVNTGQTGFRSVHRFMLCCLATHRTT